MGPRRHRETRRSVTEKRANSSQIHFAIQQTRIPKSPKTTCSNEVRHTPLPPQERLRLPTYRTHNHFKSLSQNLKTNNNNNNNIIIMRTNCSTLEPRQKEVLLPSNYYPSENTVIVGRGKFPNSHIGNKRLRVLVSSFLKKYEQGDKYVKTQIVSDIILMIRVACKGGKGAFVRHDRKTGQWCDLDNSVAREKVTYQFRDLLPDQYSSSSKSKIAKRRAQRKRLNEYHPIIILSPPLEEEQEILPMGPTPMDLITSSTENDSFEEIIVAPTTTSTSSSDNDNRCTNNVESNDDVHGYAEFLMKLPILKLEESTVFQN